MGIGLFRRGLFLVSLLISFSVFAAMTSIDDDSFIPLIHDANNEDTPHEAFPLIEMPIHSPAPPGANRAILKVIASGPNFALKLCATSAIA